MNAFTFSAAFITFFSVVGPPKVLLSFAGLAQVHPVGQLRTIALISSGAAVLVGLLTGITAPWLLDLFHISTPALQLAGGVIFFIYAVGLVLGLHLGSTTTHQDAPDLISGVRELLMPYVVSPLAMTAVLIEAAARDSFTWRSTVVGAYVSVIALDLVCVLLLTRVLHRTHHATIELLGRLLGLLLAAVGVDLFLDGLSDLGVPGLYLRH
ncbi:MarC family protein [Streptomyces sp. SR27]|uniref:MarC family protein n=1 Tax=Streptomyces sp. SR27 TaxID=3076630 RepID=UPI00295BB0C9|nr:MarC family protein [Streptomyces sp. SR27]MDV9189948.1 MarC family protein [Streptomyces sp. SR27]